MHMATMEDIAKKLGISKGTVSKALSGAADISGATRKLVLETAVELGYERVARQDGNVRMCIFVENMAYEREDSFGWELIMGFRKMAEPAGASVMVEQLTQEVQAEYHYDEYMLLHGYRGGFFLGLSLSDPWTEDFKTCITPAVLYDNRAGDNPVVARVGVDNVEAMELAVTFLKARGHTRIGYLSSALGSFVYQERYDAFFDALEHNGLEHSPALAGAELCVSECVKRHLPRLLEEGCTAVMCSHDLLARALLLYCQGQGISVPGRLGVIGFDDIPLCRHMQPPLTTVRQDRLELGRSAYYALSSQINHVRISALLLHARLVPRESV